MTRDYMGKSEFNTEARAALEDDIDGCPICAVPFKPEDVCADDITEGTCHADCLEGSPVVDLETGYEIPDGKIDTYLYSDILEQSAPASKHSLPTEAAAHGQVFTPYAIDESGQSAGFDTAPATETVHEE
jgi:hypothetical protein